MASTRIVVSLIAAVIAAALARAQDEGAPPPPPDNIGHARHLHPHNPPHPTVQDPARFFTNRLSDVKLPLPTEEDAFFFVVFGDRTGGPVDGVSVLADAVRDTNLLEPDLVMTVGDLVQGYNRAPEWLEQMREFKGIMNHLLCPWFPVAGNHDVYWRGPAGEKPAGENESNFEMHFGPLWYAFEHKNCWFVALYSDEGNPETGEKTFDKPACQRMSPAQVEWLRRVLEDAAGADHVFLFLHHPRWLGGGYGDDWNRVHELLVAAGNVSVVFAGHIHHMRYDPRDGIDYVALATTGGGQSEIVPQAGHLHEFHIVTVRKDQIAIAAVPVGEVMDVREITGALQAECVALAEQRPALAGRVTLLADGSASGRVQATFRNTASQPVFVTAVPESEDSRWWATPDHDHRTIPPGGEHTFGFAAARAAGALDDTFRTVELALHLEYLAPGHRYAIPEKRVPLPLDVRLEAPPEPAVEHALTLDGRDDALRVAPEQVRVPDGPLTLECWFRAGAFGDRVGLVTKTEGSEYGIFVSRGEPGFSILLGDRYAEAKAAKPVLEAGRWYHVAGVYDGAEVRLYVDGRCAAAVARSGARRTNDLPLYIGADVDGRGNPVSHFCGLIDEVRLSKTARYSRESFAPARRLEPDTGTLLLLHMDGEIGPWVFDSSPEAAHPVRIGGASISAAGASNSGSH